MSELESDVSSANCTLPIKVFCVPITCQLKRFCIIGSLLFSIVFRNYLLLRQMLAFHQISFKALYRFQSYFSQRSSQPCINFERLINSPIRWKQNTCCTMIPITRCWQDFDNSQVFLRQHLLYNTSRHSR